MRRHPRSRTSTASGERSSYRAILLTNIKTSFHANWPLAPRYLSVHDSHCRTPYCTMEPVEASAITKPSGAQSIDRAADLVRQVVTASRSVTFSELAESSGLAKSTTSRILSALERNGLLRRDTNGGFLPGEAFVRYALRGNAES